MVLKPVSNTKSRLELSGDLLYNNNAIVASYPDANNIDHIWHNDSDNSWNFCSDTTYKNTGNSKIQSGSVTTGTINCGTIYATGELNLQSSSDAAKYMDVRIGTNAFHIRKTTGGDSDHEVMARFTGDSGVDLYHNNIIRLTTTLPGVQIQGRSDNYWGGMDLQSNYASASNEAGFYIDFKNESNYPKSHIHSILRTDGESRLRFGVTAASVSRTTDSRTQVMELRTDGIHLTNGWFRAPGNNGLYFTNHGGGWYMQDSTWIRSYGSKSIYHNSGVLRTDGTLRVGGDANGTFNAPNGGNPTIDGNRIYHDGYHPNADTLATARTISLGGHASGSASFNGGSNVTISATINKTADQMQNNTGNWHTFVNDGGGNIGQRWNATTGGTNNLVEAGWAWELEIENDTNQGGELNLRSSGASEGTAGSQISWSTPVTIYPNGNVTISGNLKVADEGTITFDDTSGTVEKIKATSGTIDLYADAEVRFFESDANAEKVSIDVNNQRIFFGGDDNTYWHRPAADTHGFFANGNDILQIATGGLSIKRAITLLPNGGGDATSSTTTKNSEDLVFMGKHWNGSASVDNYFSMSYNVESTTPTGKVYFAFGLDNNASSVATLSRDGTWDFQGNNLTEVEDIGLRDRIYHDGDTNTYFQFHGNDLARIVIAGAEVMEWGNNYALLNDNDTLRFGNSSDFRIYFNGTDTYFRNYANSGGDIIFQGNDSNGNNENLMKLDTSTGSGYVILYQNNSEKFRTQGSGIKVTGATISSNGTSFATGSTANGYSLRDSNVHKVGRNTTAGNSVFRVFGGSGECRIKGDGDLENTNNRLSVISDIKLKENIVDANSQWDDIKDIRIVNFNYKSELGYGTHTQIGVIAQEVEAVSPGLVGVSNEEDDDGNITDTTKTVASSLLYMKAVKALQEAMDRIETLESKVAALESGD